MCNHCDNSNTELLDYYAGKALTGLLAANNYRIRGNHLEVKELAKQVYTITREILMERQLFKEQDRRILKKQVEMLEENEHYLENSLEK